MRARFRAGDAQALPLEAACVDVAASALAVNFVPNVPKALSEMTRVLRSGGTVAFYVWDYPGGGIEFMRRFWRAAIALDPSASSFGEGTRFPFCTPDGLTELAAGAGLQAIRCNAIEVPTVFADFQDFWQPFTRGAGPAPGYCASLDDDARERLRRRLQRDLPTSPNGAIALNARAWAVKARAG